MKRQPTRQQREEAAIRRQLLYANIRGAFLQAKGRAITERLEKLQAERDAA